MEDLVNSYRNKTVFITGNTGFKGSWLSLWFSKIGANVVGYSDSLVGNVSHYELLNLKMQTYFDDIKYLGNLKKAIKKTKPEIVFHLAAQPLVRYSYKNPIETFETNIIGAANLLEACRGVESIKAIVVVTTDKCYENREWYHGYRENDRLGGYDPYSASKAGAEIVTSSYRDSFFNLRDYDKTHQTLLATARAGNVIGGGDWSVDRLIPDIIRATTKNETTIIRNPNATRPWQHVLEPLYGYLLLGQKLLEGKKEFAEAWNFGPSIESNRTVDDVLKSSKKNWDSINYKVESDTENPHEANLLMLDCAKAYHKLHWKPKWDFDTTLSKTISWYKSYYDEGKIISEEDLKDYGSI